MELSEDVARYGVTEEINLRSLQLMVLVERASGSMSEEEIGGNYF